MRISRDDHLLQRNSFIWTEWEISSNEAEDDSFGCSADVAGDCSQHRFLQSPVIDSFIEFMIELKSFTDSNKKMLKDEIEIYGPLEKLSLRSKKLACAEIVKTFLVDCKEGLCLRKEQPTEIVLTLEELNKRFRRRVSR